MKAIVDTSTLISLAKINFLGFLKSIRKDISMPEDVYHEAVIKGEEKAATNALVIKNFFIGNRIKPLTVKKEYLRPLENKIKKTIGKGDRAVIALALQTKAKEIITNDDGLGRIAMSMGFKASASPDLLFEGLKTAILTLKDYENLLRSLVIENRITSVIAEFYIMEGKSYGKN